MPNEEIITGGGISDEARSKLEPFRPPVAFGDATKPPEPDYSSPDAWAALPTKRGEADIAPSNTRYPEAQAIAAADVFFIHPTGSTSNKFWNAPIDDPEAVFSCREVMKYCASAFNAAAKVYAPRYRQATLYSFFDNKTLSGLKAIEFAYKDVEHAFNRYMKFYNKGRPFIVAAHSQGSIHGMRLLQEHIIGKELAKRMVAAYLIGGPIPKDMPGIEPSRSAVDTGTLIGWNTYTATGDSQFFTDSAIIWLDGAYRRIGGRQLLQVNPLSWVLNGKAVPASDNPGSITPAGPLSKPSALVSALCGADASGKVLIIEEPKSQNLAFPDSLDDMPIFNPKYGDYHNFDYLLFYESLRRNVVFRTGKLSNGRLR